MARGTMAKTNVIKTLEEAFGSNYIGEVDKKIYVWADDGGEKVQIAIALTCPKTFVEADNAATPVVSDNSNTSVPATGWNFDDEPTPVVAKKVEISEEEKKNIADIMARLGL